MAERVWIYLRRKVYQARRRELNLTHEEVARRAGIGSSTLSEIVSHRNEPAAASRRGLQAALRLSYAELFKQRPESPRERRARKSRGTS